MKSPRNAAAKASTSLAVIALLVDIGVVDNATAAITSPMAKVLHYNYYSD